MWNKILKPFIISLFYVTESDVAPQNHPPQHPHKHMSASAQLQASLLRDSSNGPVSDSTRHVHHHHHRTHNHPNPNGGEDALDSARSNRSEQSVASGVSGAEVSQRCN